MKWEILVRPGKKAKVGRKFSFGDGKLQAEIIEVLENGNRIAEFSCEGNFFNVIEEIKSVITSYSIHYTKLYDSVSSSAPEGKAFTAENVFTINGTEVPTQIS